MKQTIRTQLVRGLLFCVTLSVSLTSLFAPPLFAHSAGGVLRNKLPQPTVIVNSPGRLPISNTAISKKAIKQPVIGGQLATAQPNTKTGTARLATPGVIVISQVYGGGGNGGSVYKNDFIELFNRGGSPVDVTGWTVQYTSSAGTTWAPTSLTGTIPAGGYYLIQEAVGAGGTTNLPTPDAVGNIPMSATTGKVALVNVSTALSGTCPTGSTIIDFVGFGGANCFEGVGPTAVLTNTTAALRASAGCTDANNNAADFTTGAPTPRNSASPVNICGVLSPSISVTPNPVTLGYNLGSGPSSQTVTVNASSLDPAAGNITVTSSNTAITLSSGASFSNSITLPYTNSGLTSTTFVTQLVAGLTAGTYSTTLSLSGGGATLNLPVTGTIIDNSATTLIRQIQGTAHLSPLRNQTVNNVQGIVTAVKANGFYMQDPTPDSDDATSEGVLVFTSSAPTVVVGDAVSVNGTVTEFRTNSNSATNLTVTEITTPTVTKLSGGNTLPAIIILGNGGRTIPTTIIEDDVVGGNIETGTNTFDPATDGIDFYESLEGMRVQINSPVTVSPSETNGSVWLLADDGVNATGRTARGGILVTANDFNPERIQLFGGLASITSLANMNVGAKLSTVTGIVDYFDNYEVLPITAPTIVTPSPLTKEITSLAPATNKLTVATFNVENLAPSDGATKFSNLANRIVNNLKSPDIITLEEIQDNTGVTGATGNTTVDATTTYQTLINAITAAGGPTYQYKQIDPVANQDGGAPGGNIRQAFFFNANRVSFVDRAGGTSTAATTVSNVGNKPQISFSPGRIDPTNSAWSSSRKPLVGEFTFNGQTVFVIGNHFNSKGGDQPLYGPNQPPVLSSETQRVQQATIVRSFVSDILAIDQNANIVVLGDLNDFQFSNPLTILKGTGPTSLTTLIETLPANEQYTYNFDGNAQVLDHIVVSSGLRQKLDGYDVVHINSEFYDQDSDHDPSVARFTIEPDLTTSIAVDNLNFSSASTGTTRDFIVSITEIKNASPSGAIGFSIAKLSGFTITYSTTSGTSQVLNGVANTNGDWIFTEDDNFIRVQTNTAFLGLGSKIVGFSITRKEGIPSGTTQTINVTVAPNAGGETNFGNNIAVTAIIAN